MNGEILRVVFAGSTTWMLVIGLFWFMYEALLDPNTAAIPEANQNFIFGGLFTLVGVALAWTFNASQQAMSARSQQQATDSAVKAALATPPTPPTPPPTAPDSLAPLTPDELEP